MILYLDETRLTRIFQDKISSLVIDDVQYKNIDITDNSKANIFAYILTLFSKLEYFHYRPTFWYQSLFQIPPNPSISSSILLELHVKLVNFTDCLYLLDGRFDSLQRLSVDIDRILSPQILIDKIANKVNVIFIHIHIKQNIMNILQIIFRMDYLNMFVKSHYMMNVLLNMNSL